MPYRARWVYFRFGPGGRRCRRRLVFTLQHLRESLHGRGSRHTLVLSTLLAQTVYSLLRAEGAVPRMPKLHLHPTFCVLTHLLSLGAGHLSYSFCAMNARRLRVFLCIFCAIGCSEQKSTSRAPRQAVAFAPELNETLRTSDLGRCTFALPKAWQVERPLGSEIYSDARGAPGYLTPLVVQSRSAPGLDEALETLMRAFHAAPAFTRHRVEPAIVDGQQALNYLISFQYMEHMHWQIGTLIATHERVVALFLSAPDAELIHAMKVFDRVLETLHFAVDWPQALRDGTPAILL